MTFPVSPTWIVIYVLIFLFVYLPIGVAVFRNTVRRYVSKLLRSPNPTPTEGERIVIKIVGVPLMIVLWPGLLIFWITVRGSAFALDDRHRAIRQLRGRQGLPDERVAIRFFEDLQQSCQVPHSEILQYMNEIYDHHKDERGWS